MPSFLPLSERRRNHGGEPPQATTIRRKRLTLYVNVNLLSLAVTKE